MRPDIRRRQTRLRKIRSETLPTVASSDPNEVLSDEIKTSVILFFSTLDEKQRRLYAGSESVKIGHGGDRKISDLLGIDVHTVAKGRRELPAGDMGSGKKSRAPGGGRKKAKKKHRR